MTEVGVISDRLLGEWTERWRYPDLLEALGQRVEFGIERKIDALLAGLACPPASPVDTFRRLVERGEFAVAERLLSDAGIFGDGRTSEEFDELHNQLGRARRQAAIDVQRELRELTERSRRCGVTIVPPEDLSATIQRSRTIADAMLAELRDSVNGAEQDLTRKLQAELKDRWPDAPRPWLASVDASLAAREFGVVREQVTNGPGSDGFAGPAGVPRPRPDNWPWPDRPLTEVLAWYRGTASLAPAGFAQWHSEDEAALRLVAAMADLAHEPSVKTVSEFAAALDGLFGVDGVTHPVIRDVGRYRTLLFGLGDPRLPHLRLPGRMRLWVAQQDWQPPDDEPAVGIWFVPAGAKPTRAAPRTAVIDPADLLKLVAPDRFGMPTDRSARRINLLRTICRQLDPDDVLPVGEYAAGMDDSGLGDDLGWAFDLMGVSIGAVVIDALRYDTGDNSAALWTAVRTIIARGDGTPAFTHQELMVWRQDPDVCRRIRDAVLTPVRDDLASLLAVCTMLYAYGSDAETSFTEGNLLEWLTSLAGSEGLGAELDNLFDMPSVLSRAAATGLFERLPDGRYRLGRPGLMALLARHGLDDLIASTFEALRREGGLLVSKATVNLLLAQQRAISHKIGSRLYEASSVLSRLRADPDERVRGLAERVDAHLKPISVVRAELGWPDLRRLLRPESVDVMELLGELRSQLIVDSRGEVAVELEPFADAQTRPTVRVRRALLRLALENVLTNAVRSILDSPEDDRKPRGIVQVRVNVVGNVEDQRVQIDVEDSGPGFSDEDHRKVSAGVRFTTREGGHGVGLVHTRESLEIDQGRLRFPRRSELLGGAHVQIVLPFHTTA